MEEPVAERRRARGVDVVPHRVRQAREDAGLTLAQLADGRLSRTAIHLIETGRARPSEDTLAHIASRTGKPLGYFVGTVSGAPSLTPVESARRTVDLLRQSTWSLSHMLRCDDHLTEPERTALEGLLVSVRQGIRLVQAIHADDAADPATIGRTGTGPRRPRPLP